MTPRRSKSAGLLTAFVVAWMVALWPAAPAPARAPSDTRWSRLSAHTGDNLDHPVAEAARKRAGSARRAGSRRRAAARRRASLRGRITRRPARGWIPPGWSRPTTTPLTGAVPTQAGPTNPAGLPTTTPGRTTPTPTPTPTGPTVPDLPGDDPRSVSVVSRDTPTFSFTLSQPSVQAGRVRIQFDNSLAEDPHSLLGRDSPIAIGLTRPGKVTPASFDLSPGRYTLYCPIEGHEALGMKAELTVTP